MKITLYKTNIFVSFLFLQKIYQKFILRGPWASGDSTSHPLGGDLTPTY